MKSLIHTVLMSLLLSAVSNAGPTDESQRELTKEACIKILRDLGLGSSYYEGTTLPYSPVIGSFSIPAASQIIRLGRGEEGEVFRISPQQGEPYLLKVFHAGGPSHFWERAIAAQKEISPLIGEDFKVIDFVDHRQSPDGAVTIKSKDVQGYALDKLYDRSRKNNSQTIKQIANAFNDRILRVKRRLIEAGWSAELGNEKLTPEHPFYYLRLKSPQGTTLSIDCVNTVLDLATGQMTIIDFE